MKRNLRVKTMILDTIKMQKGLFAAILFAVAGAIISALIPPLVLARIIDGITAGDEVSASFLLLYFLLLALTGFLEAAREGLLTVFGQKMTHALRSSLMEKFGRLTSDNVNRQEPGALVSRFVGDVDTVENLFTSGIVSMFADTCKIISILAVIWFRNRGLTIVLLVLLPFLFWFTRHVQKNMLSAQIENRRAVGRASGHVPETLHNIRTIHCLKKEAYMEEQYDIYIGQSYQAMERTNFYDAIYSPVILIQFATIADYRAREKQLFDLLRNSDGKDYVVIYVRDGRSVRRLGDNWTVRADESLLGALSEAFGADNVRLTQKKI